MKKYILNAGWVLDSHGQMQWVTCGELARLYRVKPEECIFILKPAEKEQTLRGYHDILSTLIHLYPSDKGDYSLG